MNASNQPQILGQIVINIVPGGATLATSPNIDQHQAIDILLEMAKTISKQLPAPPRQEPAVELATEQQVPPAPNFGNGRIHNRG